MSNQQEITWDKLLHIKTTGRDDTKADTYRYPYEPTPYCVLERLANSGYIHKKDLVIDYGCGKGRVGFFLAYQIKAQVLGVDYDERMIEAAMHNLESAARPNGIAFSQENAVDFIFPEKATHAYFFNPFSVTLLQQVVERIKDSYYAYPREIYLYFYYPSDEYISYLMCVDEMEFEDEIDCRDLFDGQDRREQIMIFKIGGI